MKQARIIRSKLYSISNGQPLTYSLIVTLNLCDYGIEDTKINTILLLPNIDNIVFTYELYKQFHFYISNIKGIGKWTLDTLNVMYNIPGSYLTNDSYIKANIQKLGFSYNSSFFPTYYPGREREVTLLFWRIKKESICKLKNGLSLTR